MHRDKKLGLALGVLLVGIVAAMFFRLDQGRHVFLPKLKSARELDERIAEKRFTTYPGDFDDDDDSDADADKDGKQKKLVEPPLWETPAFLADDKDKPAEDWLAQTPATPDPIPAELRDLDMFDSGSFHGTPIPQHNKAWTVSDTKTRPPAPAAGSQGARTHRIRTGDTLSGLASYYLGSSARYGEIYNLNRDVLSNPNDLTVGVVLKIPGAVQQQPRPSNQSNSIFHNADGQHVIEPGDKSGGPKLQAAPSSLQGRPNGNNQSNRGSPAKRFIPVEKSPFTPGGVRDDRAAVNKTLPVKNTLTQTPPADLPNVD